MRVSYFMSHNILYYAHKWTLDKARSFNPLDDQVQEAWKRAAPFFGFPIEKQPTMMNYNKRGNGFG